MELYTNVDNLAKIIQKGVAAELEPIIKQRLLESVDSIISQLARDIAKQTAVQMDTIQSHDATGFGLKTQVMIRFNNKDVNYVDSPSQNRN